MEDEEEAKAFAEEIPAKKKKSVGFALDQNTVKEFDKTKKIVEVDEQQQHYEEPKKSVSHENMDDMVSRTVKTQKKPVTAELSKSYLASVEQPQTGSQFERDYKSFKGNNGGKLEYLLKTVQSEDVIKKVFKSTLETDILIDIVKVFSQAMDQPNEQLGQEFIFWLIYFRFEILEFLKALCVCWPFDMAVEFLNEAEKNGKIIGV